VVSLQGEIVNVGERVYWHTTKKNGCDYTQVIAGIVREVGRSRIKIELRQKFDNRWEPIFRWVAPESLSLRDRSVDVLDAELDMGKGGGERCR